MKNIWYSAKDYQAFKAAAIYDPYWREKPVETCPEQTKTLELVDKDIKNNQTILHMFKHLSRNMERGGNLKSKSEQRTQQWVRLMAGLNIVDLVG